MGFSILPNFIIGGASAAGTSFLFDLLRQHPDIYLPADICSEPHFFAISERYNKGIEWYQKIWFSDYKNQLAIGERSSAYLYFPETAARMKKHLPAIKLIFVLRNPIERAFAQYRYRVLRGTEPLDFTSAIYKEESRLQDEIKRGVEKRSHDYRGRSLYGKQLQRFLTHFSRDQMLILSSEKLRENTENELKKITDFLQIGPFKMFQIISDFSTPSVKDPLVQFKAREHFGNVRDPDTVKTAKWEALLNAIRYKQEDLSEFITSKADAEYIDLMKSNFCNEKETISEEIKALLMTYFQEDQALLSHMGVEAGIL